MKIALIGNMNNCFFSIMRYLRDLEMDVHLFLYQNEYKHFLPENDTYDIKKYRPFIHMLAIADNAKGLVFFNKKTIKEQLSEFDFFIGFGIAPALFYQLNYTLDIFIPYADIIEKTVQEKFKFQNIHKFWFRRYVVSQQIKGIKHNTTKLIGSAIEQKTKESIKRLGIVEKHIKNYAPIVYKESDIPIFDNKSNMFKYIELISKKEFVIFCHARHHWKDLTKEYIDIDGDKGQNKLIVGYSYFIKNNPSINPILIFFEYGKDVDASKKLIYKLGIEKYVKWLPLMPRKDILNLIVYSDIVVNSLSSAMWGGTGFEGLACGKILMQNITQTDKEYLDEMGHELPFLMRGNKAEDVENHLKNFIENREYFLQKSKKNKVWFDKYAGIGLAKEYKKIIEQLYREKNR